VYNLIRRQSILYRTASGAEPYADYVNALRDRQGAAKIKARVTRAEMGNLGDHRTVGHGVIELRIDFGPGYRIYVGLHGSDAIVLLCAGDKATQSKDVARAHAYWKDYRENS
jgi:putative addiction module killer protein